MSTDILQSLIDESVSRRHSRTEAPLAELEKQFVTEESVSERCKVRLSDIVLEESVREEIRLLIDEHLMRETLSQGGLRMRKRVLLVGSPGNGKSTVARVIADELDLVLRRARFDKAVNKSNENTQALVRDICGGHLSGGKAIHLQGLEFAQTDSDIRAVMEAIPQRIPCGIVLMTINGSSSALKSNIQRCADDVIEIPPPGIIQCEEALKLKIPQPVHNNIYSWKALAELAQGLSFDEVTRAAEVVEKRLLLYGSEAVSQEQIQSILHGRNIRARPFG